MVRHPLPDDLIELIARRFRVLADPTRIKLLDLLRAGEATVNDQVPVERQARTALREVAGTDTIPALRLENSSAVVGEENILVYLSEHVVEPLEAEAHQQKAAKARRRYLEEECQCSQPATRS